MDVQTHLEISHALCGVPTATGDGTASVRLLTTPEMVADDRGLVHGGFVFGLADHAAMVAVNHPHVVLGAAEVRFTAPVAVGETVVATATTVADKGRKQVIEVTAAVGDRVVFSGSFTTFVLDGHVLDRDQG